MEVSCFLTSRSFNNALDLVPSLKRKLPIFHKFGQALHGTTRAALSPSATCYNLASSLPNDDSVPWIESDWRSFRAKLVGREQASKLAMPLTSLPLEAHDHSLTSIDLVDKWAHPLREPERGCLLIATGKLDGVHVFERAVILLLSTGPIGPTSSILNQPSKETPSTAFDIGSTLADRPLFFGGPLDEGLFLVSSQQCGGEDGVGTSGTFEEVIKGVYHGTKETVGCAAEMVKRNVVGVGLLWVGTRAILKEEIRAGSWSVAACIPSVIGLASSESAGLWEQRLGPLWDLYKWVMRVASLTWG